ncbi:related to RPC37 - RNA polymerase III subunit C37 [Ustilago trichophora]|uniref:Related to RPC37 - RNA polymerase III subunit C37 n=1 Tax=Ustilago trichophora TaxID=86804 RepID=A0A5C3E138_9BASI|nr:related to RPC37 - RNA polymerase III subunit C37 [Ustilago trichophora]
MEADQLFLGSAGDVSMDPPSSSQDTGAPSASTTLPTSSATDLPPDSELVASLPVYLSKSLLGDSSLHIFQYPIYPRDRPLPVPYSAAARGLKVSSRWRPRANRVEVELPLDVREEVYNTDRGVDFGAGAEVLAQRQARADAAHGGTTLNEASSSSTSRSRVKKEKEEEAQAQAHRGPKKLEKIKLESNQVPNATEYMVGVIRDQALHLTRLESIVQLRPSMNYLDAIDEAREAEKRRDRAALAGEIGSDEEDEEELIEMEAPGEGSSRSKTKKDVKKPAAQTLSVALRTDPNAVQKGGGMGMGGGSGSEARDQLMAAQREADAERWVDLEWRDERSLEAQQIFDAQLFAGSKAPLTCKTKPREYLLHALP